MRVRALPLALALLAGALLADTARGATQVFGRSGETLSVLSGSYASLFPGGGAAAHDDPVLALEVRNTLTGSVERLLVPGTGDPRLELSPSIVFEPTSERAYLVWEARTNAIHSQVLIGSHGAGGWTEPIEVNNGSSYALKGSPQVAVSRDRFFEVVDGVATQHSRTVVHVVWWQETNTDVRAFLAPVTIVDGQAPRALDIVELSELDRLLATGAGSVPGSALQRHPILLPGRDQRRVVVGFIGANSGLLTGIELEALPREVADLADRARGHIIDLAADPTLSQPERASRARAFISEQAHGFHPVVVSAAADQVAALVGTADGGEPAASLGERARGHIIDLLGSPTVGTFGPGSSAVAALFATADPRADAFAPHLFAVRAIHGWEVPAGLPESASPLLSQDARAVAIAWACADDSICFVEHEGDAWSASQRLPLRGLSFAEATALVRDRLDRR